MSEIRDTINCPKCQYKGSFYELDIRIHEEVKCMRCGYIKYCTYNKKTGKYRTRILGGRGYIGIPEKKK